MMIEWLKNAKMEIRKRKADKASRENEEKDERIRKENEEKDGRIGKQKDRWKAEKHFCEKIGREIKNMNDEGSSFLEDIERNMSEVKELRGVTRTYS